MKPRRRTRPGMFLRLLLRATLVRRGRAMAALSAVVVAGAVTTAMLNLYADVDAKMRKEFRSYGANLVVVARDGGALPPDSLARVDAVLGGRGLAVPFAYAVARTADGQPVVVAGTDFQRVRSLDSWWSVTAWPQARGEALVGVRAKSVVAAGAARVVLTFAGRPWRLTAAGTVRTGAGEDSRVFLDLAEFEKWTGVQPASIEIAASGPTAEVEAVERRIASALPMAEVRPIRQIVEGEARVLGKTRASLLAAALIIILTAALCVLATLTASVLDRRRDFAIMKALGASERLVSAFFAAEAAAIGLVGAVLGFGIGLGAAAWIGRVNFHAAVAPRFGVFPVVMVGSLTVALLSAALPMALLRRVQPALMLRGE